MALTAGNAVVGTTTLASLMDTIYANKTGSMTGASATFTALDSSTIKCAWTTNNGDNLVYIYCNPRAVAPAQILL